MSDDIVTRLRKHVRGDYEKTAEFLLGLAADEIERLRADRERWRALAEYLCQNAPSMIVPNEIARLFPDPLPLGNRNNND